MEGFLEAGASNSDCGDQGFGVEGGVQERVRGEARHEWEGPDTQRDKGHGTGVPESSGGRPEKPAPGARQARGGAPSREGAG